MISTAPALAPPKVRKRREITLFYDRSILAVSVTPRGVLEREAVAEIVNWMRGRENFPATDLVIVCAEICERHGWQEGPSWTQERVAGLPDLNVRLWKDVEE